MRPSLLRCRGALVRRVLSLAVVLSASTSLSAAQRDTTRRATPLFPVVVDSLYGYIDTTGAIAIELRYWRVQRFSEGLGPVNVGPEAWGYVDKTGRMVITPQFLYAGPFFGGRATIKNNQGWGYIDRTGKVVINPRFYETGNFSQGLAAVLSTEDECGFIDTTGMMVIAVSLKDPDAQFAWTSPAFSDGRAAMPSGRKWGYADRTGRMVIPARFERADRFAEKLAAVRLNGKWGFIDTTGTLVIQPQFDRAGSFSEGLAEIAVGRLLSERSGYIDRTGSVVIQPQFAGARAFSGGLALVVVRNEGPGTHAGRGILIDRTGRHVWDPKPVTVAQHPPEPPDTTPSGKQTCTAEVAALGTLPGVAPSQQSAPASQAESTRPILYYEEVDGRLVLSGVFPDGRRVAMRGTEGVLYEAGTMPRWSPDGAWMAYAGGEQAKHTGFVALVNLRGARRPLFATRDSIPLYPRWSPDGRFISVILLGQPREGEEDETDPETIPLVVISVADQAVRSRLCIPSAAVASREPRVRWSSDGQKILLAGDVAVVATIGTGVVDTVSFHQVKAEWGPTSDAVYYFTQPDSSGSTDQGTLAAFFLRGLTDRQTLPLASADLVARLGVGPSSAIVPTSRRVTLSPDGERLAVWGHPSKDSTVVLLYEVTAASVVDLERPIATFRLLGQIIGLHWGPQGRSLAAIAFGVVQPDEQLPIEIRQLDVGTGEWRKLATVRTGEVVWELYTYGRLSLSWTQ